MKLDQIVLKRFNELFTMMNDIESSIRRSKSGIGDVDSIMFHQWGTSVLNVLQKIFGEESVHFQNFKKFYDKFYGDSSWYDDCVGIFKSAKEDYEKGYLFNLRSLINAEILDDVLEQSEELLKNGYKDHACVIVGVVLERALKDLCNKNNIPVGKLDKMNADLCKAGIYNIGMQKQITAWADRRNNAAHGNWNNYSKEDIEDMIKGVNRFIAEYL